MSGLFVLKIVNLWFFKEMSLINVEQWDYLPPVTVLLVIYIGLGQQKFV
jgi:hypothetical protein